MEEDTVEFKMDVSDESIKRKAIKVVFEFPGVTLVDIKDKKILKVKGSKLEKIEMGCKLRMIDESVDMINPSQKAHQPSVSSIFNYFYTPKEDIVVFEFKVLNEVIIPDAMEVIWEFSGITSVEVRGIDQIKVRGGQGQINKLDMVTKLQKKIDNSNNVEIRWFGEGPEAEKWPDVKHAINTGSSKVPTVPKPLFGEAGTYARQQHAAFETAKAEIPVTHNVMDKAMQVPKLPEKRGHKRRSKLLRFLCLR